MPASDHSTPFAPIPDGERIELLDFVRGVAVLGILLLNITGFGLPKAYDDPTLWGGASGADLAVWRFNALLTEGTMRGLFTLLFGASVLLFLERAGRVRFYFRRTMLLILFGLCNGYLLLWSGDILFFYGVTGLLLYGFRTCSPRTLVLIAFPLLCVPSWLAWVDFVDYRSMAATVADLLQQTSLSDDQQRVLTEFRDLQANYKPDVHTLQQIVIAMQTSYRDALHVVAIDTRDTQTNYFLPSGLTETLGMMLLGMAVFRLGWLQAIDRRVCLRMMLIGWPLGIAINLYEIRLLETSGFSVAALAQSWVTYDAGRIPLTFGHLGALCLLAGNARFAAARRALTAVGRMALTNYLAHSVIALFLFTGAGLAWFGDLRRHELYYVVAVIWLIQIPLSCWWLRRYRFGPAEWLWRTLTYGRMQPWRR